ncbi:hypothetical protein Belba_3727 [Belliella baltica DSM 15883]|uniref:Integral membrane protein n=1 Tax=Belliella baltica (strain DSM 15883 / CIP 108006 / LMG 21964 / BA134) TaxID=866536 RepID=I3ZAE7_BELBD|nr:membrane protein [Belliella baltica]AFL86215.1 hypothetical protein Belba_3727 [Belliella baltica DSM 15883]
MIKERLEALRMKGYDFDIQDIMIRSWQMFKKQALLSIAFTMLIFSIQLLLTIYIPDYALLHALFLAPPLYSGFYLVANKISQNETVVYPDFFKGFNFYILVFSIWLIGQVLTAFGLILLIVPGIYLAVSYSFSVLMGMFGGFDFWNALEESRKLITIRWWKFFVFSLILISINLLGFLTFGLSLLVSIPMTFYATYILFEDLTKEIFLEEEKTNLIQ